METSSSERSPGCSTRQLFVHELDALSKEIVTKSKRLKLLTEVLYGSGHRNGQRVPAKKGLVKNWFSLPWFGWNGSVICNTPSNFKMFSGLDKQGESSLESKLKELEKTTAELEEELKFEQQRSCEVIAEKEAIVGGLKHKLCGANEAMRLLRDEHARDKKALEDRCATLVRGMTKLESKIENIKASRKSLEERHSQLTEERDELRENAEKKDNKRVAELSQILDSLKSSIEDHTIQNKSLAREVSYLRSQKTQIEQQILTKDTEILSLRGNLARKSQEIKSLKEIHEKESTKHDSYITQLADAMKHLEGSIVSERKLMENFVLELQREKNYVESQLQNQMKQKNDAKALKKVPKLLSRASSTESVLEEMKVKEEANKRQDDDNYHWIQYICETTMYPYYVNVKTGETTWVGPSGGGFAVNEEDYLTFKKLPFRDEEFMRVTTLAFMRMKEQAAMEDGKVDLAAFLVKNHGKSHAEKILKELSNVWTCRMRPMNQKKKARQRGHQRFASVDKGPGEEQNSKSKHRRYRSAFQGEAELEEQYEDILEKLDIQDNLPLRKIISAEDFRELSRLN